MTIDLMDSVLTGLIIMIALLHVYFMVLEMFLWTKPPGRRIFRLSEEQAQQTQRLAANQGLYNGFLAAGLIWSAISAEFLVPLFFLICVFIAGVFGALTVSRKIFWVQALPAMLALILLFQID
jgi:putative membrane protein